MAAMQQGHELVKPWDHDGSTSGSKQASFVKERMHQRIGNHESGAEAYE